MRIYNIDIMKILNIGHNYIEFKFTNKIYQQFLENLISLSMYIEENYKETQTTGYWALSEVYPKSHQLITYRTSTFDVSANSLFKKYNLSRFFNKLNLEPFIGKVKQGNFDPHCHFYSPTSTWNICIPDKNTTQSTVCFWDHNDINKSWLNSSTTCLESNTILSQKPKEIIKINPENVYSFHTTSWHTLFTNTNDNKVDFLILYLKNTISISDAISSLKTIESKF